MITDYIPLTPEQKYFNPPGLTNDAVKELADINAAAGINVSTVTIQPDLNLDKPQFIEEQSTGNKNALWWVLGIGIVATAAILGVKFYKDSKRKRAIEAQSLRQQPKEVHEAFKNKVKESPSQNDITFNSEPPQSP